MRVRNRVRNRVFLKTLLDWTTRLQPLSHLEDEDLLVSTYLRRTHYAPDDTLRIRYHPSFVRFPTS